MTHKELCERACVWLKRIGCRSVISEMASSAQEEPDAIGWRSGVSILVECKTSRADFKRDKKKIWRRAPDFGMGSWRFFMCEPDIIKEKDLMNFDYSGWGLIYVKGDRFKKVIGPLGNCSWGKPYFKANQQHEINLLVSALSRQ